MEVIRPDLDLFRCGAAQIPVPSRRIGRWTTAIRNQIADVVGASSDSERRRLIDRSVTITIAAPQGTSSP